MKKVIGIYKIINPIGQVYIGQSFNLKKRITDHKHNKSNNSKLSKSLNKFGYINHIFEIIELCQRSELRDKERYWQDFYDSSGKNGLNMILTKTKLLKGTSQQIQIEAMRSANLGSIRAGMHSEDFKDRQRQRLIGNCLNPTHNKKSIIQLSIDGVFIKEWDSLSDACKSLGINIGNTGDCANGKRNKSAGFKWKYKN